MNRDIQASQREIAVENRQAVPHRDVPGMRAGRPQILAIGSRIPLQDLAPFPTLSDLLYRSNTDHPNCVYEDANRQACKRTFQRGRRCL